MATTYELRAAAPAGAACGEALRSAYTVFTHQTVQRELCVH